MKSGKNKNETAGEASRQGLKKFDKQIHIYG